MTQHIILRVLAKLLIPLIMLFGLYVQFHGDYGPGGGFQAGVIFAAAIVLYALIFGIDEARRAAYQSPLVSSIQEQAEGAGALATTLALLAVVILVGAGIAIIACHKSVLAAARDETSAIATVKGAATQSHVREIPLCHAVPDDPGTSDCRRPGR